MTKNLYYRSIDGRANLLRRFFINGFLLFSSYPRLLLEVFTRKDFGQRYFRLSAALTLATLLAAWPFLWAALFQLQNLRFGFLMSHYLTWYGFIALFVLVSLRHHREIKRSPSVYDFARYSLCTGRVNPAFFTIKIPGVKTDLRLVETLLEPAPFFVAGVLLWLLHQALGPLLTVCAIWYALAYIAAYDHGDNFVLDKIDEMIANEEMKNAFVDDLDSNETRGFRFMGRKPQDPRLRRQLLPFMVERDDEVFEAV